MNTRPLSLLALFLVLSFFALEASAAPRYRCNGRVQSWPCGTAFPNGKRSDSSMIGAPRPLPAVKTKSLDLPREYRGKPLSATVLSSQFMHDKKKQGVWTGKVFGNGEVKLFLQIFRGNKLESTSAMGSTILAEQESSFTFKSTPPPGTDWSYVILAQSLPVIE